MARGGYSPIGTMPAPTSGSVRNVIDKDPSEPRGREKPEAPPPTQPVTPGGGGDGAPGGGGGGELGPTMPISPPGPEAPPDPTAPAPSMPEISQGNPFLQPGSVAAHAAFRTPAFFSNRYVGGFQDTPVRVGPGAPIDNRIRPVLNPETLRALVARFGRPGGFGTVQ